jgi:hypothetical protein
VSPDGNNRPASKDTKGKCTWFDWQDFLLVVSIMVGSVFIGMVLGRISSYFFTRSADDAKFSDLSDLSDLSGLSGCRSSV